MFGWFGKKDIKEEVIPTVEIAPVIGEPVLSIIEAMKDLDAWTLDGSHNIFELKHKENQLVFKFFVDFSYRPYTQITMWYTEWATKEEQKAMCDGFKYFLEASERIQKEYTHMSNQLERMKYMAFVKEEK